MGVQALEQSKAVSCVGRSFYAVLGLARSAQECSRARFWTACCRPGAALHGACVILQGCFCVVRW